MRQLVALDTAGRRHFVIRSLFAQRLRLLMALNVTTGCGFLGLVKFVLIPLISWVFLCLLLRS